MNICARLFKRKIADFNLKGLVLMYHRVVALDSDPWQLAVSPANFAEQMNVLRKVGVPVKMSEFGGSFKQFTFGKKKIAVTFDDGYIDNFKYAKPILEQYQIPATFFIVSGAINSREEFWWDELDRIILVSKRLPYEFVLSISEKLYSWRIVQEEQELLNKSIDYEKMLSGIPQNGEEISRIYFYCTLWQIINTLTPQERRDVLNQIIVWSGQSSAHRPDNLPMAEENLKVLSESNLFEIGAHTNTHPMLSRLSFKEQEDEILQSKNILEKIIDKPVTSFSYPFGNYTDATAQIVKRLKFNNASTTEENPVMRTADAYLLPRYAVLDWNGDRFEQNLRSWLTV